MYLFKSESFATEQDAIDTEETVKSTKTHELFSLKVRTLLVHNDVFVLKVKKAFNVSLSRNGRDSQILSKNDIPTRYSTIRHVRGQA